MRIFDCFPFFNEFDVLDTRLAELGGIVDTFVLVEATRTHTGHPKPLYYDERRGRYIQQIGGVAGRVAYKSVELQGPPSGDNPGLNWGREATQRDAILGVLAGLKAEDDDIVLSLDVDEIPVVSVIEEYKSRQDICCIEMPTYHYSLNTRLETPTVDPKICRYRDFKAIGPSQMRYMQTAYPLHVLKGGWHLSFMGGVDKVIEKVKAYAHYDDREPRMQQFISRENVEASIRERKSIYMRPDIKYVDDPNPPLPKYIAENLKVFVEAGWIRDSRPTTFFALVKSEPGRVRAYAHGNESGTLWEKLWIFDGIAFRSKTCASGCFADWYDYSDEATALCSIERDFEIMRTDR